MGSCHPHAYCSYLHGVAVCLGLLDHLRQIAVVRWQAPTSALPGVKPRLLPTLQVLVTRQEAMVCKKLPRLPTKPQRPSEFQGSALQPTLKKGSTHEELVVGGGSRWSW